MTILSQTILACPDWIAAQNPSDWLTPRERAACAASPSVRRNADRLAGRFAVKRLIFDAFGVAPLTWEIGTDGVAPIGLGLRESINLSLSHSDGVGAAAWAETGTQGTVGVDIQRVRPIHRGLAARILAESESADSDEDLLCLWAIKEAAIKARRRPWGKSLRAMVVTRLTSETARVWDGETILTADCRRTENGWLARALLPPSFR